jgi:DNA modification methylase
VAFVIAMNIERRHLTPSQRAAVAVEILSTYEKSLGGDRRSEEFQKAKLPSEMKQARDVAAAIVHVGPRYVSEAKAIKAEAPELFEEVKAGLTTLQDAKKEVHNRHAQARQAKQVKEFKNAVTKATILCLDIRDATPEAIGLPRDGADAIITDPPYPHEFLPLFGNLAKFAGDTLRDGGSLIVMSGEAHLPEVYRLLTSDPRLTYQWTMAYLTPGAATQLQGRPIASNWKPLVWLTKGAYHGPRVGDIFENPKPDKEHHLWGQGEIGTLQIIDRMTTPGALVVDPFLGGGTTGVCCVKAQRRFIGFDLDKEAVTNARARIAKAEHDYPTA